MTKIVSCILFFLPVLIMAQSTKLNVDWVELNRLNELFIKNFINQDTISHNKIIHKDFVCIQNSGRIENRDEYMKDWASAYEKGQFKSFTIVEENIRIFENTALVRARTKYTKVKDGKTISGGSVYTDTYIKENGRWWCIQVQITPVN
jgi:hypothetical protein